MLIDFWKIGISGFRFLAQALGSCPKLERLDLQGNAPMARDVLLEILSALDAAPKGVKVNLFGWEIRGEEFVTLRRVIGGTMAGHDIGQNEVEVISAALRFIGFITDLDLKGTTMNRTSALEVGPGRVEGLIAAKENKIAERATVLYKQVVESAMKEMTSQAQTLPKTFAKQIAAASFLGEAAVAFP